MAEDHLLSPYRVENGLTCLFITSTRSQIVRYFCIYLI